MAFKNNYANEFDIDSISIYAKVGRKIVYTAEKDENNRWHGTRTEYYVPPVINLPYFDTIWYGKVGDMTDYGFYTWTMDWVTFQTVYPFISYGNTLNAKFSSRGNSNYRELVDFSAVGGKAEGYFRTKLHCDTPKSTMQVSYVDQQAYTLYLNGQKFTHPVAFPDGINMNTYRMYTAGLMGSDSFPKSTTELNYNCGNKTIFYPLEFKATCGSWHIPEPIEVYQSNSNGEFFYGKATEHSIYIKATMSPMSGYTGARYDDVPMSFNYKIIGDNLPNASNLKFTSNEMQNGETWTGLTSPKFTYLTSQNTILQFGGDPQMSWTTESHTESEYYQGKQGNQYNYKLSDDKPLPTTIGNVTCTNPQLINNYTQEQSETQEGQEPEQIRNGIFKIIPNLNCDSRNLLSFSNKELANSSAWQLVNCHLNDDNEIIVDGANPYVYQEFFRNKYSNEIDPQDTLANTEYRQRHFTHFRYMNCNFIYRDITEPQVESEYQWHQYKPKISLICKSYGDITGHTWTTEFDGVSQHYDLLQCNANSDSSLDEYGATHTPEYCKIANTGITYIAEQPCTTFGYLPNIVGRIEIPIDTNPNYRIKLGNLDTYYSLNVTYRDKVADLIYTNEYNIDSFNVDYNEKDSIDVRVEDGKVYFNETVENPTFKIITDRETIPVVLDSWQHNSILDIDYCKIEMTATINGENYTVDLTKQFATNRVVLSFKTYEEDGKVGIYFQYCELENDETTHYFYQNGILMIRVYYDAGFNIDLGSEFQEPLEFGQTNPREEGSISSASEHTLYHNRFLNFVINGARSFEIPEIIKEKWTNGGYEFETWHLTTTGDLKTDNSFKGNRKLYFRDDLGEIYFNIDTYAPDGDGHYIINALTKGTHGWVNWLKVGWTVETYNDTKYKKYTVYIKPRVDQISSNDNKIARFINSNGNSVLYCVADYGASVQGIDQQDNNSGNIVDNSPYANSGGITLKGKSYLSEKHGTDTTINLNTKSRHIEKVIDGGKYHFSIVKVLGYIWRNINGLILRDNQGKIEQGGGRQ